jgi:Tol biopolymer transport system component
VSLDPSWSPDGKLLAYVKSPSADTGGQPSLTWFKAHRLFVFDAATRRSTEVARADGASVPTWSKNGKEILYVRDNALWVSPVLGGKATELETPLFPPAEWQDVLRSGISFYGQVNWGGQFSWWSR